MTFQRSRPPTISVRQRMELWPHIMMCGMCRRLRSNIIELRKHVRGSTGLLDQADIGPTPLPPATKARLEEVVKRQRGRVHSAETKHVFSLSATAARAQTEATA